MEAGSKRTAKANSIVKLKINASIQSRKTALTLRGKSAKFFKIKLGDTIFNGSMWDYEDVTDSKELLCHYFYAFLKFIFFLFLEHFAFF